LTIARNRQHPLRSAAGIAESAVCPPDFGK
jgi:hypothetical protein